MLISELDLYKREWLELVFANRNKQYGAYELRRTSKGITSRALGLTLALFVALSVIVSYAATHRNTEGYTITPDIPIGPPPVIEKHDKVLEKPKVQPKQAEAAKPLSTAQVSVKMQRFVPPVVAPDDMAEDLKALDAEVAVGPVETKGTNNAINAEPGEGKGVINGKGNATEGSDLPFDAVEIMPQPVGGDAAWAKFLQKYMRYPAMARDNDKSGKVYLSFIVERDGRLSDITVIRKAGFGFDEEALRVLKLAPAWKPGIQNGATVRVRYTVPIAFQLATE